MITLIYVLDKFCPCFYIDLLGSSKGGPGFSCKKNNNIDANLINFFNSSFFNPCYNAYFYITCVSKLFGKLCIRFSVVRIAISYYIKYRIFPQGVSW